jgi:hypothetical protein
VTVPVTGVTYTTEDFVRRTVGRVLRGKYRGGIVCSWCLVGMTLERLHTGWRKSEIEQAMEKVFNAPGVLVSVSSGPCARCKRPHPCIGAHSP